MLRSLSKVSSVIMICTQRLLTLLKSILWLIVWKVYEVLEVSNLKELTLALEELISRWLQAKIVSFILAKLFGVNHRIWEVIESVMMGYLELFQLIVLPLHMNTHLNVDLLSSGSNIKSESVYPWPAAPFLLQRSRTNL